MINSDDCLFIRYVAIVSFRSHRHSRKHKVLQEFTRSGLQWQPHTTVSYLSFVATPYNGQLFTLCGNPIQRSVIYPKLWQPHTTVSYLPFVATRYNGKLFTLCGNPIQRSVIYPLWQPHTTVSYLPFVATPYNGSVIYPLWQPHTTVSYLPFFNHPFSS